VNEQFKAGWVAQLRGAHPDDLGASVAHFFGVQPGELERGNFNMRRRRVWFGRATS